MWLFWLIKLKQNSWNNPKRHNLSSPLVLILRNPELILFNKVDCRKNNWIAFYLDDYEDQNAVEFMRGTLPGWQPWSNMMIMLWHDMNKVIHTCHVSERWPNDLDRSDAAFPSVERLEFFHSVLWPNGSVLLIVWRVGQQSRLSICQLHLRITYVLVAEIASCLQHH